MKKAPEKQAIFKSFALIDFAILNDGPTDFISLAPNVQNVFWCQPSCRSNSIDHSQFWDCPRVSHLTFLVRFLGEKVAILSGLLLTLVSGVLPMFASVYTPILNSRFLIRLSIGTFNSLAVSLIPEFYSQDEEEMATMIGYQNVLAWVSLTCTTG